MIEDICDGIYEAGRGLSVGHFVWCPVPYLDEVPRILEVERASSEAHYATKFEIVQMSGDHFKRKSKLPIKALALGETEELLISKAKKRPCIVVSAQTTTFEDETITSELRRRRHLQDNSMILAPLYGLATPDDPKGFPPVMVARIRAFLYYQFFYLPQSCPKTKVSIGKESIVRLDRLFAASPSRGVTAMDKKLSAEPLSLLLAVLVERLGGKEDENLSLVRELLFEQLPEDARPKTA